MILIDANLLLYAYHPRAEQHEPSRVWLEAAISSWLAQPNAGILEPGERHWDILRGLVREGQTAGPLVMDAVIAAIALEHGATLYTTDRDFSRFPGLSGRTRSSRAADRAAA